MYSMAVFFYQGFTKLMNKVLIEDRLHNHQQSDVEDERQKQARVKVDTSKVVEVPITFRC